MRSPRQRHQYRQQLLRWVGLLTAVLVVMASLGVISLWRLQSVQLLSVQSNSMMPLIQKGDAVLVRKLLPTSINVGDMISYPSQANTQEVITHRVVFINTATNQVLTKGDANISVDPVADATSIIGGVQSVVPKAGFVIDMLHSWRGLMLVVYVPAALILAQELWRLIRYYIRPTYKLAKG